MRLFLKVLLIVGFYISNCFAQSSQLCTENPAAEIVIMMDKTASLKDAQFVEQKSAIKKLLHHFENSTGELPRIAIGQIQCPDDDCSYTKIKKSLTSDYDSLRNLISSLGNETKGKTNLKRAIKEARLELEANGQPHKNQYIILFTDGMTNLPTEDPDDGCLPSSAKMAAKEQAKIAKELGIKIATAYIKPSTDEVCDSGIQPAKEMLKFKISSPNLFFTGLNQIETAFLNAGDAIICDDNQSCTVDSCGAFNLCISVPAEPADSDGDLIDDCSDQCPGADDNLIGVSCSEGLGICHATGNYVCDIDQLKCNADTPEPASEICNNLDDDCDGDIDEGFGLGESCSIGVGACKNSGAYQCDQEGDSSCSAVPSSPSKEECNGLDDDCDGLIDEGNVCSSCVPQAEICDGLDNDCDGQTDNGLECNTDVDTENCQATNEICDGVDNDCDGFIDEGEICFICDIETASTIEIKAAKKVKKTATVLKKRVDTFTYKAEQCTDKSYAALVKKANFKFNKVKQLLEENITNEILVCSTSICSQSSNKKTVKKLNKLARGLFKAAKKAKLSYISDCKIPPHETTTDHKVTEDYLKDMKNAVKKLPPTNKSC